eukprot:COSAG02_NODE_24598_length_683_cov_0.905822_2_plen_66_part_01
MDGARGAHAPHTQRVEFPIPSAARERAASAGFYSSPCNILLSVQITNRAGARILTINLAILPHPRT